MIALSKGHLLSTSDASLFSGRSLISDCGQYILVKPKDVPMLVQSGVVDIGFVTEEVLIESGIPKDLFNITHHRTMPSRLCLLGKSGGVTSGSRIATQFPRCAKEYINRLGIYCEIIRINGSAEIMPSLGLCDFVIDVVSTGVTAKEHGLRILDVVMTCDLYKISRKDTLV